MAYANEPTYLRCIDDFNDFAANVYDVEVTFVTVAYGSIGLVM